MHDRMARVASRRAFVSWRSVRMSGFSTRRQFIRYGLMLAGGVPLMAACSTAAAPTTSTPSSTPPAAAAPTSTASGAGGAAGAAASVKPTAAQAAAAGGIAPQVTIAAANDIDTADPHINQSLVYGNVVRLNVFNALVRYADDLSYVPDLAETWENPDAQTYVFHLRQGVKYHNGQELEASHVEYSYKRIADKKAVFASRVANIDIYEVLDKYTIRMHLSAPQADFIDGLVGLSIVSPEVDADLDKKPVGSGPFQFVEWVPNDHITLQRYPGYFEPNLARVDKLVFKVIPGPASSHHQHAGRRDRRHPRRAAIPGRDVQVIAQHQADHSVDQQHPHPRTDGQEVRANPQQRQGAPGAGDVPG